jgi:hypothetical protein
MASRIAKVANYCDGGGSLTNHPFGHGEIDHPCRAHQERSAEFGRRAEDHLADQQGQRLRARAKTDRVATGHPCAVSIHVPLQDRRKAEDDRHDHGRAKQEPQCVQQRLAAIRVGVELG